MKQVVALKSSNSIDGKSGITNLECKRHHPSSCRFITSLVDFHSSFKPFFEASYRRRIDWSILLMLFSIKVDQSSKKKRSIRVL